MVGEAAGRGEKGFQGGEWGRVRGKGQKHSSLLWCKLPEAEALFCFPLKS